VDENYSEVYHISKETKFYINGV